MIVIKIGRSSSNNVVIHNDPTVSKNHCELVVDDKGICKLRDLDSTNGVYVNGRKITGEVVLSKYDTVRIGNTQLPWMHYIDAEIKNPIDPGTQQTPNPAPVPIVKIPEKNRYQQEDRKFRCIEKRCRLQSAFLAKFGR